MFSFRSNKVDTKLFNWNDYMQYIECRNSVISQYNYLLHKNIYGNNIRNTQIFINDWNTMKSTLPIVESNNHIIILLNYFKVVIIIF